MAIQARHIWEAMLYAQPKIRTDTGLATLALLVRTFRLCFDVCLQAVSNEYHLSDPESVMHVMHMQSCYSAGQCLSLCA